MRYYTWRQHFLEKYNKISSKIYEHLMQQTVQQKVQRKVRNNYVALLIKQFVFSKLVGFLYL